MGAKDKGRTRKSSPRKRSPSRKRKRSRTARRKSRSRSKSRQRRDRRRRSKSKKRSRSRKRSNSAGSSSKSAAKKAIAKGKRKSKSKSKSSKVIPEVPAAQVGPAVPDYGELLRRLYRECNPGKIGCVEGLMQKYAGQEADMYERVCKKYGVTPALPGARAKHAARAEGTKDASSVTVHASDPKDLEIDELAVPAIEFETNGKQEEPPEPPAEEEQQTSVAAPPPVPESRVAVPKAEHQIVSAEPETEEERPVWEWLKNLDHGRGALLEYFDVIRSEFDADFAQIAAARLPTPISPGTLGSIDPSFFKVLGVTSAGHRLLLAKGIMQLDVS